MMSRAINPGYQYLQRSKIQTNKFQKSLPRLKIPSLDKTKSRLVSSLEPIFNSDTRIETTKEAINDFFSNQAKDLQNSLQQYDKQVRHSSYINQFWFDMYLSSRVPLPLNFNPFLAWRDAPSPTYNDQLVRATNFIISASRFKRSLEEEVLAPEVFHLNPKTAQSNFYNNLMSLTPDAIASYVSFAFKAFPLDMSQYKNLFNSTRIPRENKDEIMKHDPNTNRHIIVMKNGNFYYLNLYDQDNNLISPKEVYAALRAISDHDSKSIKTHLSISEFTTAERNFWANERDHLLSLSENNKMNLRLIDSSMFVVCLDELATEDIIIGAHNFLHGSNLNGPINRWFDKSFSILITKDGHSAINFEHSWGDGVAILRFFNDTYKDHKHLDGATDDLPIVHGHTFKRLDFDLDSRLKDSITKCRDSHLKATDNLELGAVQYDKMNREYYKKNKLSPDSMSQLAFQIAFRKLYNKPPVTYESCSTAAFRGGRTETVRPCTSETNAATEAILKNGSSGDTFSKNQLKDLLQQCSKKHYKLCAEASMGRGFDRHLFGLREIATREGKTLHPLFNDPIYLENQQYVLSTSTLYGECFSGGGFAPVTADGFGLGYGYVDRSFGVLVSSYKDARSNSQMVQSLNEALDDIRKIIE